jgi:hypothetical protein
MKTQSMDTSESAEKVLVSLVRKADFPTKLSQVRSLSQMAMQLSKRAIARANTNLSERQIDILFVACHYGQDLARRLEEYLSRKQSP